MQLDLGSAPVPGAPVGPADWSEPVIHRFVSTSNAPSARRDAEQCTRDACAPRIQLHGYGLRQLLRDRSARDPGAAIRSGRWAKDHFNALVFLATEKVVAFGCFVQREMMRYDKTWVDFAGLNTF